MVIKSKEKQQQTNRHNNNTITITGATNSNINYNNNINNCNSYNNWRHLSLSGLTPMVFNTGLTHLGSEAFN